ncbi:ABC transporter ATP-binding protein [Herbiconiux sp. VKM Ac-1786]|uniref:dipeptide ABC transporter ATP-binding protein n=1 Tax=Herbiconiux sp. VKM Ac-1786 TaxID=2783824 RepID=UPI00188A3A36|nr:ABC transporter ATP-binding protein [Herbiconiux sp. VKM Ac-1786]MBF4573332.1 ABC transporter ATP-binding protein [Herbiconiux sp. VKM Ac-1786]
MSGVPGEVLLRVEGLRVGFGGRGARRGPAVVDGVSFTLEAGRALAIVGESGSGKSVTARSLVGLAGAGAWTSATALKVGGASVLGAVGADGIARGLSGAAWRRLRGREVGLVVQDALVSLDPLRPIGREIGDALRLHTRLSAAERRARVLSLLESVGMPDPASRVHQRSGELSGGLRQRALIASALAASPRLVIADEPTTALDSTVQAQILALLEGVRDAGTGLLFISHDLAVVSRIADDVLVMRAGRVVESGPAAQVLGDPQHEYTKALLRAVPTGVPRGVALSAAAASPARPVPAAASTAARPVPPVSAAPVLEISGVSKRFGDRLAVDDVTLTLPAGTTLGLVGESGSGKTTLARIALGLADPDAGTVRLDGLPWAPGPERDRRSRRPLVGAVYQDALSSFDPRMTVRQILADALRGASAARPVDELLAELLDNVGLSPSLAGARPLELSGGQRQRVSIARALAPSPRVIVLDEPVSALDVSIQAQILDLLDRLQREHGVAYLFISHDLGVVQHMSDTLAVMKDGRVLEQGRASAVFDSPAHPYTQALLAAAPRIRLG